MLLPLLAYERNRVVHVTCNKVRVAHVLPQTPRFAVVKRRRFIEERGGGQRSDLQPTTKAFSLDKWG